jgi:DNA replication protein DnaC
LLQDDAGEAPFSCLLSQLLKAELAEREVRSIAYHMKAARFPAYRDLSGFDFAASEINEANGSPS